MSIATRFSIGDSVRIVNEGGAEGTVVGIHSDLTESGQTDRYDVRVKATGNTDHWGYGEGNLEPVDGLGDEAAKNILAHIDELARLKTLSDMDLIRECMNSEASDYPVVEELMNRVRPGWLEEL